MSSSLTGGSSPLLVMEMVGIASSSLTPGSSIASVAGKKRLPAISWADAPVGALHRAGASTRASAGMVGNRGRQRAGTAALCHGATARGDIAQKIRINTGLLRIAG